MQTKPVRPPVPRRSSEGRALRVIAATTVLAMVGLATGVVGVVENAPAQAPTMVGICHATDSGTVLLVVDEDGFEHGHHRHHEADYFVDPLTSDCDGALALAAAEADVDNATEPVEDAVDDVETVAEEPAANETAVEESEVNQTAPEPEPVFGDGAVDLSAWQDNFEVVLTATVGNTGDGVLENTSLSLELPDLRRAWHLGGADSGDCTISGLTVSCWFGALESGQGASVTLRAYTDRMPCGEHEAATAVLDGLDDANLEDNDSSAGILARSC